MLNYRFFIEADEELVDFKLSMPLVNLLININHPISKELLSLKKSIIPYLNVSLLGDKLSYISSNRLAKISKIPTDAEVMKYSQDIKVGRIVKRLIGDKFTQKDIEDFSNLYKAAFDVRDNFFEVVNGEKIRYWYFYKRYKEYRGGTLWNSCMRYDRCQEYFDIYVNNPDKINMLILKDKENQELIVGRAILWKLDRPNVTFLDRVYYNEDYIVNIFMDYAIRNGWYYKNGLGIYSPDGIRSMGDLLVRLKPESYRYYPYVDTLCYYNPNTGEMGTDVDGYELSSTDGMVQEEEDNVTDFRGDNIPRDEAIWCDIGDAYCHQDEVIYLDYYDQYATPEIDTVWSDKYNSDLIKDRSIYSKYHKDYFDDSDDNIMWSETEHDFLDIDNDNIIWDDERGEYIIKKED